eukprot:m.196722 g.196722  ORF g.196722 m.196722 type:complete len:838 (-) comp14909_c1_seq16:3559-6072(-)
MGEGTCAAKVGPMPNESIPALQFGVGSMQFAVLLALIAYLQINKRRAANGGDAKASLRVPTPVHQWILWAYVASQLLFAVGAIVFPTTPEVAADVNRATIAFWMCASTIFHFIMDGLAVFLCMKGIGSRHLIRAALISAAITLLVGQLNAASHLLPHFSSAEKQPQATTIGFYLQMAYEALLGLMYLILWLAPRSWFFRRPAIKPYAIVWTCYRPLHIALLCLMFNEVDWSFCAYTAITTAAWCIARPILIYYVLIQDTIWWTRCGGQQDEASETSPLLKDSEPLNPDVALQLQRSLPILSSCPRIPFCEILVENRPSIADESRFQQSTVLNQGGGARVHKGKWKGKDVAVRQIFQVEYTADTIKEFAREAKILSYLRHPNIVQLEGVCIHPPFLGTVLEYCSGNLRQWLNRPEHFDIELPTRLMIAIDCVAAVDFLHELGLVHADIKSLNYLLGAIPTSAWSRDDVAQWLVCERLGEFKDLFSDVSGDGPAGAEQSFVTLRDDTSRMQKAKRSFPSKFGALSGKIKRIRESHRFRRQFNLFTVKLTDFELLTRHHEPKQHQPNGSMCCSSRSETLPNAWLFNVDTSAVQHSTPRWSAPEVLNGARATKQSDMFSLGLVVYEILTANPPFPTVQDADVRGAICAGALPALPDVQPEVERLFKSMCAFDPSARMTASATHERLWTMLKTIDVNQVAAGSESYFGYLESPQNTILPPEYYLDANDTPTDRRMERSSLSVSFDQEPVLVTPTATPRRSSRRHIRSQSLDASTLSTVLSSQSVAVPQSSTPRTSPLRRELQRQAPIPCPMAQLDISCIEEEVPPTPASIDSFRAGLNDSTV